MPENKREDKTQGKFVFTVNVAVFNTWFKFLCIYIKTKVSMFINKYFSFTYYAAYFISNSSLYISRLVLLRTKKIAQIIYFVITTSITVKLVYISRFLHFSNIYRKNILDGESLATWGEPSLASRLFDSSRLRILRRA